MTYEDTGNMTPAEREIIIQLLEEDSRREKEALEQAKKRRKSR